MGQNNKKTVKFKSKDDVDRDNATRLILNDTKSF